MELRFPYAIAVGIPVILLLALLTYGVRKKFKDGHKVANTEYIEKTPYFKRKLLEYRFCSVIVIVSIVLSLSLLMALIARPFRSKQTITEIHNRDIFLCLDTSSSMFHVDLEVCDRLKEFVSGLHGERFGITIFNCQTVTLVPLTTDYDYIIEVLDQIKEACQIYIDITEKGKFYDTEEMVKYRYIIDGTQSESFNAGSSLIGDGLATSLSAMFGGPANTTYGENTGVLELSKVHDPKVIRIAAVYAIVLSFIPKMAGIIGTMPSAIVGGISFMLYGMISAIGVRNVVENKVDFTQSRNLIIAAVILVSGLGFSDGLTFTVAGTDITLTSLAIAAIAGILLNAIIPGRDYEYGAMDTVIPAGDKFKAAENNASSNK